MKNFLLLALLTLGVMISSCDLKNQYYVPNTLDSGIIEYEDYYISWIDVADGDDVKRHEVILKYPEGTKTILEDTPVSHIRFEEITRNEEKIDSTTHEDITQYIKKVSYNFHLSEFVIPVSYIEEYALWRDPNGIRHLMPALKVGDVKTEISLTALPCEIIDGRVYDASRLLLEVFDNKYVYSAVQIKLLLKTMIIIDESYNEQIHIITI